MLENELKRHTMLDALADPILANVPQTTGGTEIYAFPSLPE
jgi:hypothetical protein